MRLIDADAMKEELLWGNVYLSANETNALVDLIDNQPTIDPESLRPRGRWERMLDPYGKLEGFIHVKCGFYGPCAHNFCPNCGAKMED